MVKVDTGSQQEVMVAAPICGSLSQVAHRRACQQQRCEGSEGEKHRKSTGAFSMNICRMSGRNIQRMGRCQDTAQHLQSRQGWSARSGSIGPNQPASCPHLLTDTNSSAEIGSIVTTCGWAICVYAKIHENGLPGGQPSGTLDRRHVWKSEEMQDLIYWPHNQDPPLSRFACEYHSKPLQQQRLTFKQRRIGTKYMTPHQ